MQLHASALYPGNYILPFQRITHASPDDLQRIRDNFAAMSNEALLHFARHEGHKIAADAFLVLREELRHRNIGADIIHYMEHEIMLQDSLKGKDCRRSTNSIASPNLLNMPLSKRRME